MFLMNWLIELFNDSFLKTEVASEYAYFLTL